jgi:hypothetical protein
MRFARSSAIAASAALVGGCLAHPAPPAAPYHAIGSDGWHLIIDDKHVTYIGAGQAPILQPRPRAIVGVAGDVYQTPRLNVNVVHAPCVAGDRAYPDRVQVSVDGVQHNGCGGL